MAPSLDIVESRTKINSYSKFFGWIYHVLEPVGHLKKIPKKKLDIDVEHMFAASFANNRSLRDATDFHRGPS